MSTKRKVPVITRGVEPWQGKRAGWMPYFTVTYPGQPEDKILTYEYFESREMALEKGRLIALLHLKRLLDGS